MSSLAARDRASTLKAHCTKYNLAALREYLTKTFRSSWSDRALNESFESLRRFSRSVRRTLEVGQSELQFAYLSEFATAARTARNIQPGP